ncbi:MAG: DUF2218 domain-containing protein [Pseudomonadota bacterium]
MTPNTAHISATAHFPTARASRYLTALCHHFARKVAATCDETSGTVQFPFGQCRMTADAHSLHLNVTAPDHRRCAQTIEIVTNHLERFAFRENPDLTWQMDDPVLGVRQNAIPTQETSA